LSACSTAPVYGSTYTRVRPPGVRSSGKRMATRYGALGPAAFTEMGDAPGIAARAAAIAASGAPGRRPGCTVTGGGGEYGSEPGALAENLARVLIDVNELAAERHVVREIRRDAHAVAANAVTGIGRQYPRPQIVQWHRQTRWRHREQTAVCQVIEFIFERHHAPGQP